MKSPNFVRIAEFTRPRLAGFAKIAMKTPWINRVSYTSFKPLESGHKLVSVEELPDTRLVDGRGAVVCRCDNVDLANFVAGEINLSYSEWCGRHQGRR